MGFCAFSHVHDTAATRAQYLALSKVLRSRYCLLYRLSLPLCVQLYIWSMTSRCSHV